MKTIQKFEDLQGHTLTKVEKIDNEELRFYITDDCYVRMCHEQDCCEWVRIEDIVGDLEDLVGVPLLLVEETINTDDVGYDDSYTWTYYRFRTIKGSVDIRWYGSSNGYYSERVDIEVVNVK